MVTRLNFGLRVPSEQPADAEALRAFVLRAEELGFHSIWVGDHVFYHMDVLQPLHFLTWVAALTRRVRLGTAVMLTAYLNPVLLAKAAATVDVLSDGRLTLGLSLGGTADEYASIGVPQEQRLGRLLENVAIMRALWRQEDGVNYEGKYYRVQNGNVRPKPRQPGGVPIYLGATSDAMLRRAARLADGWVGSGGGTPQQFLQRARQFRTWAAEAGRDPDTLGLAKLHNISVDVEPAVARQRAQTHWRSYYGPRWSIEGAICGGPQDCEAQLREFQAPDVPEVTLALEPATLDLGHLELLWRVCERLMP